MAEESRGGVTIDRCDYCEGLWFDARELDALLAEAYPHGAPPPEQRIPHRGESTRRCPRCDRRLVTAGWTGLVLDRCEHCRGLFVEAHELAHLEREQPPFHAVSFEQQFQSLMISAGWAMLTARMVAIAVMRFMR